MTPKCPYKFDGNIEDFLRQNSGILLSQEQLFRGCDQVIEAVERGKDLIVRSFKDHTLSGYKYTSGDKGRSFRVGDNEPVIRFWRAMYEADQKFNLSEEIFNQDIPISIAPGKGEKQEHWKKWGSGDNARLKDRWRGYSGGRWKLCHIFQAAPQHLYQTDSDIIARFVRNFFPINHFWFVSEYNWKSGRYIVSPKNAGENRDICLRVFRFFLEEYNIIDYSKWFTKFAKIDDFEIKSSVEEPVFCFELRVDRITIKSDSESFIDDDSKNKTPYEFIVKENTNGRFHLSDFGISIGGPTREKLFIILVKDVDDNLLARSRPVSAKVLGIANRGTMDYNRDSFFQRDFFVYKDGEIAVPFSAIARRTPWEVL